jgi:hypothetical protein
MQTLAANAKTGIGAVLTLDARVQECAADTGIGPHTLRRDETLLSASWAQYE